MQLPHSKQQSVEFIVQLHYPTSMGSLNDASVLNTICILLLCIFKAWTHQVNSRPSVVIGRAFQPFHHSGRNCFWLAVQQTNQCVRKLEDTCLILLSVVEHICDEYCLPKQNTISLWADVCLRLGRLYF